jgi:hypothetical protein
LEEQRWPRDGLGWAAMAWGGRGWHAEGGDGGRRFPEEGGDVLRRVAMSCGVCSADVALQRAASSCERRCPAGCGGGRHPAECVGVRRRPAGGGKGASDCVGQRGLRPAEGGEGFGLRMAAASWYVVRAAASCGEWGVIWGEVFFLSIGSDQLSRVSSIGRCCPSGVF